MLYDVLMALKIMRELRWMTELPAIDAEIGWMLSAAEVSSTLFKCTLLQVRYRYPWHQWRRLGLESALVPLCPAKALGVHSVYVLLMPLILRRQQITLSAGSLGENVTARQQWLLIRDTARQ